MIFTIANFRGVENAKIYVQEKGVNLYNDGEIHPVTLTVIAGTNFQGKTSTSQAATALLTGEPKIYPEIKKKTLKELVMDGKEQAMATLEAENFKAKIIYPECELETEGDPISASRMAMGLESFVDMDKKGRLRFYCEAMGADPTKEQLIAAFTPPKSEENPDPKPFLPPEAIDKMWDNINQLSWDAAHLQAEEKGRSLKSKWKQITGESAWGINKAGQWLPPDYSPEIMNAGRETLVSELSEAQEWYDAGRQQHALDEAKLNELQGYVDGISDQKAIVDEIEQEVNGTKKDMLNIQDDIDKLKALKSVQPCPHCEKLIETQDGVYIKSRKKKIPDDLDEQIKAKRDEYDAMNEALQKLYSSLGKNKQLLSECFAAEQAIKAHEEGKSSTHVNLVEAEERYNTAKTRLAMFDQKSQADETHEKIKLNVKIVKVLAPDGLRLEVLSSSVEKTKTDLKDICDSLGWGHILLDKDMNITFISENGHEGAYWLTSKSEQFRIRATLQIYFARLEKAPLVVFDDVDVLDSKGRNGLVLTLMRYNIPSMVVMTMAGRTAAETEESKAKCEKLAKAGITAYWMKGGRSYEIK